VYICEKHPDNHGDAEQRGEEHLHQDVQHLVEAGLSIPAIIKTEKVKFNHRAITVQFLTEIFT
jgi:hypothetical protein